jgi:hypothetical protein
MTTNRKHGDYTRLVQAHRDQENAEVMEEQNIAIIDYKTDKPSRTKKAKVRSSREWHNVQEGLKYQAEVERQRAMAEVYRNMLSLR